MGRACGDAVVDWKRVISIVYTCPVDILFSVEWDTAPDAVQSFQHSSKLL